jgi:hypothetical protein
MPNFRMLAFGENFGEGAATLSPRQPHKGEGGQFDPNRQYCLILANLAVPTPSPTGTWRSPRKPITRIAARSPAILSYIHVITSEACGQQTTCLSANYTYSPVPLLEHGIMPDSA